MCKLNHKIDTALIPRRFFTAADLFAFDDGSVVLVTNADLDGYDPNRECGDEGREIWADLSVVYRVRHAGQAALTRLSCLWLRCNTNKNVASKQLHPERSCMMSNRVGDFTVNIHVY